MVLALCVAFPQMKLMLKYSMCSGTDSSASRTSRHSSTNSQPLSLPGVENPTKFLLHKAKELAETRQDLLREKRREKPLDLELVRIRGISDSKLLDMAYDRCGEIFLKDKDAHSVHTFFGRHLLEEEKLKGIWAVWAWGRRIDEFVDGINGSYATPEDMVRWEQRTVDLFKGRPWDLYDLALSHTVSKYSLDIQLFFDLIEGTKSDIQRTTFRNFDEKRLYRYYVASSFFLMLIQVCGISSQSKVALENVYEQAITYSIGLSEADGLRDIAYDANRGRVYLPQDELAMAGLTDADIYSGEVSPKWIEFMEGQIKRAKLLLDDGEKMINELSFSGRWWIWTCGLLYRQDLDAIRGNNYSLTKWELVSERKLNRLWAGLLGYAKANNFI